MKRSIITNIGFVFFIVGFISLFLSLVGVRLTMLAFLDNFSSTASFVAKLIMIMLGFILIYVGKTKN